MRQSFLNLGILLLFIFQSGCGGGKTTDQVSLPYQYALPIQNSDGWIVGDLRDHGVEVANIESLIQTIKNDDFVNIDSVQIIRNGVLILDENFRTQLDWPDLEYGNSQLGRHSVQSVSKSIASALVGIAIDQGYIASLEDSFYAYFPEYTEIDNWSEAKNTITIEDVLTMRHGLEWDEWTYPYGDDRNTQSSTQAAADPVLAVLGLPLINEPGTTFAYATGFSSAVGQMLANATGQSVESFAQQNLFTPLGITNVFWHTSKTGYAETGYGLFLKPRSMSKIGQLYLNNGQWSGQQIIPESWISLSTSQQLPFRSSDTVDSGYGLHWWIENFKINGETFHSYAAEGNGGQYIFVFPELELVLVFTGNNYTWEEDSVWAQPFDMIRDYILPAID